MLLNLEHAHKGTGMRECAYQTLLQWKGIFPLYTPTQELQYEGAYQTLLQWKGIFPLFTLTQELQYEGF